VQRALVTEAFHLARQSFRAQLGLRLDAVNPKLQFGQSKLAADWVAFSDGSYRPGRAAVGVLLTQTHGEGSAEVSLTLGASCPLETELAAAIVALQTLHALGARKIDLNVDSLGVFRAFESRLPLKYCLQEAEMTRLVAQFDGVTVTLVPRLHNHAADRLAAKQESL
jgi:ribonuclease HI